MKKQAYLMIGALVFFTLLSNPAARAQSANELIANIPFAFSAGDQQLPAGKYTFNIVNRSSDERVVRIRSLDGRHTTLLRLRSVSRAAHDGAKLVFNRYGTAYFFAEAWGPAGNEGLEAPKSKAERAMKLAGRLQKTETVVLTRK